jgi:hypothetical protein
MKVYQLNGDFLNTFQILVKTHINLNKLQKHGSRKNV